MVRAIGRVTGLFMVSWQAVCGLRKLYSDQS